MPFAEIQKFLNDVPLIKDIGLPIAFMVIQLFIIDRLLRRVQERRDKRQWTSLRSLFFSSAYSFYQRLMGDILSWRNSFGRTLDSIRAHQALTENSFDELTKITFKALESMASAKIDFFNALQTSAPSLRSSVGPQIDKLLVLYGNAEEYLTRVKQELESFDRQAISDRAISSQLLADVWAKMTGFEITLLAWRDFSENFKSTVREEEELYFYKGSFVTKAEFDYMTATDEDIARYREESAKIPRKTPIVNFFDM